MALSVSNKITDAVFIRLVKDACETGFHTGHLLHRRSRKWGIMGDGFSSSPVPWALPDSQIRLRGVFTFHGSMTLSDTPILCSPDTYTSPNMGCDLVFHSCDMELPSMTAFELLPSSAFFLFTASAGIYRVTFVYGPLPVSTSSRRVGFTPNLSLGLRTQKWL